MARSRALNPILCTLAFLALPASIKAETLSGALVRAYHANPTINSGRAGLRAADENVPRALSQFRPRVSTDAMLGFERRRSVENAYQIENGNFLEPKYMKSIIDGSGLPRSAVFTVEQPLFDGFKTRNSALAAETGVFAGRERLRLLEQRVLLDAVVAYMNVLRDSAAFKLQQNNVAVLAEQLRQAQERYAIGQLTLTDISQAEARLSGGRSQAAAARAALEAGIGVYKQIIGERPSRLAPSNPIDHLLPRTQEEAERVAQSGHPLILAALHDADVADLDIKVMEADFLPTLSVVGKVYTQSDVDGKDTRALGAQVLGKLSVPIYRGGEPSARVRQAKEIAGQRKFDVDVARAELLALVHATWGALEAAKIQVAAARSQIVSAERALNGVREEARAGQRTTIEILNAQQELLNSRIGLVMAQRDRIVASYAVLAAVGRLSARNLGLSVVDYDPGLHFDQVKHLWGGTMTPSGR